MIANNNHFFTPETGIEAAAKGIELCVKILREKFPDAPLVVAKILPAHAPATREGWTFRREFEHASVFVDVEVKIAKIDWK